MTDKILAVAALIGALVNLGMLIIHCRRDKAKFRDLRERQETMR